MSKSNLVSGYILIVLLVGGLLIGFSINGMEYLNAPSEVRAQLALERLRAQHQQQELEYQQRLAMIKAQNEALNAPLTSASSTVMIGFTVIVATLFFSLALVYRIASKHGSLITQITKRSKEASSERIHPEIHKLLNTKRSLDPTFKKGRIKGMRLYE